MSILKNSFACVLVSSLLLGSVPQAFAADYEYPELLVTPRASERLEMEAKGESEAKWTRQLPLQVSALTTLTAGLIQTGHVDLSNDPNKHSPIAGIVVGGGWLVTSALLSAYYHPYASGAAEVRSVPGTTKRDQLLRERIAEEALDRPAALGWRLTALSIATNLGASIYMMADAEKSSLSQVADGVSIAMALAPLVFQYRWMSVAREQQDYKKKIYAPLASAAFFAEPGTGKARPGIALGWAF